MLDACIGRVRHLIVREFGGMTDPIGNRDWRIGKVIVFPSIVAIL